MGKRGDDEHGYSRNHLESVCEPCFEFRQSWTHVAAALNAFKSTVGQLNQIAAQHFIADRTELASELKRIAKQFQIEQVEPLSKKLDEYIKEGSQR